MRVRGSTFPSRIWNEETIATLRRLFPTTPATDIAEQLHCSSTAVLYMARKLGIERDPSFHRNNFIGRYTGRGRYK